MHYIVKMLVKADNAKKALYQAERDCEQMIEYGYIDYYDLNGRWGESKAYGIKSNKGKQLLDDGMKCSRGEFDESLEAIRYMLDHFTDDEIYNETFVKTTDQDSKYYLSRYQFSVAAGRDIAAVVYAMDGDLWGGKVVSNKDLNCILESNKKQKLWVIPVDVHN